MVWNLKDNPVIVYNTVKELVALSKTCNFPKTQDKIFNIGVEIVRKTRDFGTGLIEWFERPAVGHTWYILNTNSRPLIMSLK